MSCGLKKDCGGGFLAQLLAHIVVTTPQVKKGWVYAHI
jgi:hypothetical protein